jgi:hypothetical protein
MGLQKISNHYPWPEDTLERVRAITYKFNPAWFEEKTDSDGTSENRNTEADSRLKQNDTVMELAKAVGNLSAQMSALQRSVEGMSKQPTGKAGYDPTKSSGPKEVHATGPVHKPVSTKTTKPKQPPTVEKPKHPLAAYHPSRLIVNLRDLPVGAGRLSEQEVVKVINKCLQNHDDSKHLCVTAAKYNAKSSCIVFTREDQTAEELQKHQDKFLSEMACGAQATTRLDLPWWKIQIHNMWTGIGDGKLLTGEEIWAELNRNHPVLARMALLQPPQWMRFAVDMEREGQAVSSVVISLQNEDDAKALLERRSVTAFGHFCEVKQHAPTRPDQQCTRCWGRGHVKPRCTNGVRCRLCGENHEEKDHPPAMTDIEMGDNAQDPASGGLKCAQCGGGHVANDRRCPERARFIGMMREREETGGKTRGRGKKAAGKEGWTEVGRGGAGNKDGAPADSAKTNTAPATGANTFQALTIQRTEDEKVHKVRDAFPRLNDAQALECLRGQGGDLAKTLDVLRKAGAETPCAPLQFVEENPGETYVLGGK